MNKERKAGRAKSDMGRMLTADLSNSNLRNDLEPGALVGHRGLEELCSVKSACDEVLNLTDG
jgi:hypothetical protein